VARLDPKQESSGDRAKLGRISKRGNKHLRPPRSAYDLKPGIAVRKGARHAPAAAVLLPIAARPVDLSVILIQRPETMAAHAGQISFPGGKVDAADPSPVETAVREAEE
jgi:hypothetical protein